MRYERTTYSILLLFGLLFLVSCVKYLRVSALPASKMTTSEELKYIADTDQNDRKKGLFAIIFNTKKGKLIQERDSIRADRVYQFYSMDSLKTDEDKFNAGLILIHSNDTSLRRVCYNIFEDLEKNGTTVGGRMNGANWKKLVYN